MGYVRMKGNDSEGFIEHLINRGYLYQCTDMEGLKQQQSVVGYIGFDCTASSLHLGSLVQIMILRIMQRFGLKPIVLLGGGTTKIGDPSGKTDTRKMIGPEVISANLESIKSVILKFLDPAKVIFVDNADWLDGLSYVEFLRDFGQFFSVNSMLAYESVKTRLAREQHLSFIEFNYPLLQAYDFCKLYDDYGCILQIGGSDQWGNITAGIDVARRTRGAGLYGLTTELIVNSLGEKMGKTATGAIWLDGDPYDYWQYFRNVDDRDVARMLRLFTDIEESEITKLAALKGSEINDAKKVLATEAVKIAFDPETADKVAKAFINEFENQDSTALPQLNLKADGGSIQIIDLVKEAGLAESSAQAKQLIRSGAVKIDDIAFKEVGCSIHKDQFTLKVGKRRYLVALR